MPTYHVKLADGHTYEIKSPTELSDADVAAQAQAHHQVNPPPVTTPYLAAQDKAAPPTHQPNVSDSPGMAALKETLKIDPGQTATDFGQYLKSLPTGVVNAVRGAVSGGAGAVAHPYDTLMNYIHSTVDPVKNYIQHPQDQPPVGLNMENISKLRDPSIIGEQVGPAVAAELIPGAVGAIGRGIARLPDALVQGGAEAAGAIGGAATHVPFGPYTGMRLARTVSGAIKPTAEQIGKLQRLSVMMNDLGLDKEFHPSDLPGAGAPEPINPNAPSALDKTTGRVSTEVPPGQGSAAPNLFPEHKPMQPATPGGVRPEPNPNTTSAGSLPAGGDREAMLKDIFGGEDLRDVFNGQGGVQRRSLPTGMRGDYPPDIKGDYSNYPQAFESVGGGTTPPSAGGPSLAYQHLIGSEPPESPLVQVREGGSTPPSAGNVIPPESAAQLRTAAEPRTSVRGLDEAVSGVEAPEEAPGADSPAARLAKMLGTPSDAEMQAQIASRQYKS